MYESDVEIISIGMGVQLSNAKHEWTDVLVDMQMRD